MNKTYLSVLIIVLLQSCANNEGSVPIVSIHKIADSKNTWCYSMGGHIYNSFLDSTLFFDEKHQLCSRFRPDLQEDTCIKLKINKKIKPHFDSICYSNDTDGRYCIVLDAIFKDDSCHAFVYYPIEKQGEYRFSLTNLESSLLNMLLLQLPTTSYVKVDKRSAENHTRYSSLSTYDGTCISHIFANMLSDNIDENIAMCLDAIESIACWHINDTNMINDTFEKNVYREHHNMIMQHYGVTLIPSEIPPPFR
ncbi:MAG: hypothetical protein II975_05815 [Bacteroidales bacterium]|nr:hypothetical protein [Bacteroidales bacterium]